MAYISGFCGIGSHEGSKRISPSGKPLKTCTLYEQCKCDHPTCHSFFDRMFAEAGLPRIAVDNSGYHVEDAGFIRPTPTIVEATPILSSGNAALEPGTLESVAPGIAPPVKRAEYGPTASGRAARGQLEAQVNSTCTTWVVDEIKYACTPKYISEEIAKSEGIKPPSTGAITAVLERWTKIGYATMEKKPTRFTGFTEKAVQLGLEELKRRSKR